MHVEADVVAYVVREEGVEVLDWGARGLADGQ